LVFLKTKKVTKVGYPGGKWKVGSGQELESTETKKTEMKLEKDRQIWDV